MIKTAEQRSASVLEDIIQVIALNKVREFSDLYRIFIRYILQYTHFIKD